MENWMRTSYERKRCFQTYTVKLNRIDGSKERDGNAILMFDRQPRLFFWAHLSPSLAVFTFLFLYSSINANKPNMYEDSFILHMKEYCSVFFLYELPKNFYLEYMENTSFSSYLNIAIQ